MYRRVVIILVSILVLMLLTWFFWPPKKTSAPTLNNTTTNIVANQPSPVVNSSHAGVTFSTADLPDRDPAFEFSLSLPTSWRAEYVPSPKAVNIYDPAI